MNEDNTKSPEDYQKELDQINIDIKQYLPQNTEEYIRTFRQLAAITADAMDYFEKHRLEARDPKSLTRIALAVETISALRGDSGIFESSRPELQSFQKEMYATEDALRDRLVGLGYEYPRGGF